MTKLTLISVGHKVPAWVQSGYREYIKRLTNALRPRLVEISPARRGKGISTGKVLQQEAQSVLKAIPGDCYTVLLDERGKKLSTMKLSDQLKDWLDNDRDVCFIIGGPDGVDKSLSDAVDVKWSLSDFTLPHALIRVILAEQLYRAWSILNNHPYHRQ